MNLFDELKRRKVFRVAAVYAVVAWLLIQVADVVLPTFGAPDWVNQTIIFLFVLGFVPTLIAAWAYEITPEGVKPDLHTQLAPNAANGTDRKLIFATFGLVLLVAGFQLFDRFLAASVTPADSPVREATSETSPSVMRASIILDQSLPRVREGLRTVLSLAPDGSALAYTDDETSRVLLRDLATQETSIILETDSDAASSLRRLNWVEFSPNSQRLLVYSSSTGQNSIVSAQGLVLQQLPIDSQGEALWLSDESVLYALQDATVRKFSLLNDSDEIVTDFFATQSPALPRRLPGGAAVLLHGGNLSSTPTGQLERQRIFAFDLNTKQRSLVTNDGYDPQYVNSGHILFIREGDLWAVPFDPDTFEVLGLEARVLRGVDSSPQAGEGSYSVSDSGRFVYLPGSEYVANQSILYWSDRSGNREEIPLRAGSYAEPRLSPEGNRLALTSFQADGSSDVWVLNFSTGAFNPITFAGNARNPVWTPDGSRLVYQLNSNIQNQSGRGQLWITNSNGTGQAELILDSQAKTDSFSPLDDKLVYMVGGAGSRAPIHLNTLSYNDDTRVSAPLFNLESQTFGARVSPDGRWIAYGNDASGQLQIFIQPYPNLDGGKWQITADTIASREPQWGPNSDELFFLRNDGVLMHTELTVGENSISAGIAKPLLTELEINVAVTPNYLVSPDGERILHFYSPDRDQRSGLDQRQTELIVIENFFEELRRLVPVEQK